MPQSLTGPQVVNQGLLAPSSVPARSATVATPSQATAKTKMTTSTCTVSFNALSQIDFGNWLETV